MRTLRISSSEHTLITHSYAFQILSEKECIFGNAFEGYLDLEIDELFGEEPKVKEVGQVNPTPLQGHNG